MEIWLPYGRSEIPVRVPDERLIDIFKPDRTTPLPDPIAEATKLLRSNETFIRKASNASRVCIVLGCCGTEQLTTDLTRAVLQCVNTGPSSGIILCTDESPDIDVNSLNGTRVLRHTGKSETTECNPVRSGLKPQVNSDFANADLKVIIGELRPHHFLRYAGLCDLAFPYLASESSKRAHLSDRPSITLDDLHLERLEIAKSFDNLFMLGLALDAASRPATLVFDEVEGCLRALEPIVDDLYSQQITKRADILVMSAGGAPFDETLASAVETFPTGLSAVKKEGVLIIAAECADGHGGGQFYEWSAEHKEPRYLESRLRHRFSYDGFKASFLSRILQTHRVYLVSTIPDHYVENVFGMRAATTVNAALQTAQRTQGSDSMISVIPNACRAAPKQPEAEKQ